MLRENFRNDPARPRVLLRGRTAVRKPHITVRRLTRLGSSIESHHWGRRSRRQGRRRPLTAAWYGEQAHTRLRGGRHLYTLRPSPSSLARQRLSSGSSTAAPSSTKRSSIWHSNCHTVEAPDDCLHGSPPPTLYPPTLYVNIKSLGHLYGYNEGGLQMPEQSRRTVPSGTHSRRQISHVRRDCHSTRLLSCLAY